MSAFEFSDITRELTGGVILRRIRSFNSRLSERFAGWQATATALTKDQVPTVSRWSRKKFTISRSSGNGGSGWAGLTGGKTGIAAAGR
jgi:hypothetical protein